MHCVFLIALVTISSFVHGHVELNLVCIVYIARQVLPLCLAFLISASLQLAAYKLVVVQYTSIVAACPETHGSVGRGIANSGQRKGNETGQEAGTTNLCSSSVQAIPFLALLRPSSTGASSTCAHPRSRNARKCRPRKYGSVLFLAIGTCVHRRQPHA